MAEEDSKKSGTPVAPPPKSIRPRLSSSGSGQFTRPTPPVRSSMGRVTVRLSAVDFDLVNAARRILEGRARRGPRRARGRALGSRARRRRVRADRGRAVDRRGGLEFILEEFGERPFHHMPDPLAEALRSAQASILMIGYSDAEFTLRHELLDVVRQLALRHAHMIGVTRRVAHRRVLRRPRAHPDDDARRAHAPSSRLAASACEPRGIRPRRAPHAAHRWAEHVGVIRPGKWENLPFGRAHDLPRARARASSSPTRAWAGTSAQPRAAREHAGADRDRRQRVQERPLRGPRLQRDVEAFLAREHNLDRASAGLLGHERRHPVAHRRARLRSEPPGPHIVFGSTFPSRPARPGPRARSSRSTCALGDVDLDGAPLLRAGRYIGYDAARQADARTACSSRSPTTAPRSRAGRRKPTRARSQDALTGADPRARSARDARRAERAAPTRACTPRGSSPRSTRRSPSRRAAGCSRSTSTCPTTSRVRAARAACPPGSTRASRRAASAIAIACLLDRVRDPAPATTARGASAGRSTWTRMRARSARARRDARLRAPSARRTTHATDTVRTHARASSVERRASDPRVVGDRRRGQRVSLQHGAHPGRDALRRRARQARRKARSTRALERRRRASSRDDGAGARAHARARRPRSARGSGRTMAAVSESTRRRRARGAAGRGARRSPRSGASSGTRTRRGAATPARTTTASTRSSRRASRRTRACAPGSRCSGGTCTWSRRSSGEVAGQVEGWFERHGVDATTPFTCEVRSLIVSSQTRAVGRRARAARRARAHGAPSWRAARRWCSRPRCSSRTRRTLLREVSATRRSRGTRGSSTSRVAARAGGRPAHRGARRATRETRSPIALLEAALAARRRALGRRALRSAARGRRDVSWAHRRAPRRARPSSR